MIKRVEIHSACRSENGNYVKILLDTDFDALSKCLGQISQKSTVFPLVHMFQEVQDIPANSVLLSRHPGSVKLLIRGFKSSQSDYILSKLECFLDKPLKELVSRSRIGCQIKSSLKDVVYRSLDSMFRDDPQWNQLRGEDCFILPFGDDSICIHSIETDNVSQEAIQGILGKIDCSCTFLSPAICLDQTAPLSQKQHTFESIMSTLHAAGIPIGKGHTIEMPLSTFCAIDAVSIQEYTEGDKGKFLVSSVDIISQMFPGDAETSVEIGINNALKDVVAKGAYSIEYLVPKVSAASPEDAHTSICAVQQYARRLHLKEFLDSEQLPCHEYLIGAHVGASCDVPILASTAQVGDVVVLSRPLGTLFVLNTPEHFPAYGEDDHVYEKAVGWLRKCDMPLARILVAYRDNIHAAKDISGEGLQWHLRELASLSRVDVVLDRIPLLFDAAPFHTTYDMTQETNGPVAFCLPGEYFEDIAAEMEQEGYCPQVIGRIERKNVRGGVRRGKECSYVDCS